VICGTQDTAKRDKIEIDVVRARGREKRKEKEKRGMEAKKGLGFRSTVGRGRDGDQKISQTQGPFFSDDALTTQSEHRWIERMDEVIRSNVIASFANMQRTYTRRSRYVAAYRINGEKRRQKQPSSTEYHDTRISGKERIDRIGRHAARSRRYTEWTGSALKSSKMTMLSVTKFQNFNSKVITRFVDYSIIY